MSCKFEMMNKEDLVKHIVKSLEEFLPEGRVGWKREWKIRTGIFRSNIWFKKVCNETW